MGALLFTFIAFIIGGVLGALFAHAFVFGGIIGVLIAWGVPVIVCVGSDDDIW